MVRILKKIIFIIFIFFISIQKVSPTTIIVKPSEFDHFAIKIVSPVIVAGEDILIKLEPEDAYNNPTNIPKKRVSKYIIESSKNVEIKPNIIDLRNVFGEIILKVVNKKAETFKLNIIEEGENIPLNTIELTTIPNRIDHFEVIAPTKIESGTMFLTKIIAKDHFNNSILDFNKNAKNIKIFTAGNGSLKEGNIKGFSNGLATISAIPIKAGNIKISVRDISNNISGESNRIEITSAPLDHFNIYTPKSIRAGEPFKIELEALDKFGNIVKDYDDRGKGIELISTGRGFIKPNYISNKTFRDGKASIMVAYTKSEVFSIEAKEISFGQKGISDKIKSYPSEPDHIVIKSPDSAVAGIPFDISLTVMDRFNNPVYDYSLRGRDVILKVDGVKDFKPKYIPSASFIQGTANIKIKLNRAKSFNFYAEFVKKPISLEKKKKVAKIAPHPKRKELKIIKKKIKKKEKIIRGPKPVEKEKVKVKKRKVIPKIKEEKKVAKIIPYVKKEVSKTLLKDISLIESEKQAVLIIDISGPVEYNASLKSRDSKDWLDLNIKQAVNKIKKKLRFDSRFIGDILFNESGTSVIVSLEIIPKNINYRVTHDKKAIVIKISKE